jgi:hypothetical protein
MLYIRFYYGLGWDKAVAMTKTGPNDASGVVWALGECFFLLRVFLANLSNIVVYIGSSLRSTG